MKLDAFHCALLVAIVLLAVYGFGSGEFREGAGIRRNAGEVPGQIPYSVPASSQKPCKDYPPSKCTYFNTNNRCEYEDIGGCMDKKKVDANIRYINEHVPPQGTSAAGSSGTL